MELLRKKENKVKIAIGTQNPTKVNAVKHSFMPHITAEFFSVNAPSNVSAQPLSDDETIEGAINRAFNARTAIQADIGVGLEGGLIKTKQGYFLCNWGAIVDHKLEPIVAGGARIIVPNEIGRSVFHGKELGDVMDEYVNLHKVRHNQGAIGIFTNGLVDRTSMFTHLCDLLIGQYLYQQQHS